MIAESRVRQSGIVVSSIRHSDCNILFVLLSEPSGAVGCLAIVSGLETYRSVTVTEGSGLSGERRTNRMDFLASAFEA